jgi:hypothetical protein
MSASTYKKFQERRTAFRFNKMDDKKFIYQTTDKKYPFSPDLSAYNSLFSFMKRTDEALLNSVLSYAVYERNGWMLDNINSEISEIRPIVQEAIKDKEKMYNLKVWHFLKKTFDKIPDEAFDLPSESSVMNDYGFETKFSFKNGEYSAANGLAHATVLKSPHPTGEGHILHLAFRGTEFSRLLEYIKGPYLDMSAYYENFKPLEKALKAYANDPENNIIEIHVSGHSLGGAMVQEFLANNEVKFPYEPIYENDEYRYSSSFQAPIKGFTFGSPGSRKTKLHNFVTIAYHLLGRGVFVPMDFEIDKPDPRMTQFYHGNDPVPIVGLLGYTKGGNNFRLPDVAYEEAKQANLENKGFLEKVPAFGRMVTFFKETILNKFNTKFHDSARYIMNLRNQIEQFYVEYPKLGDVFTDVSTKNWQNWIKEERQFSGLSIKYKSAFEYLINEEDPNLNNEQVYDKLLHVREKMKYDSQAEVVLTKTRRNNETYSKFLSKASNAIKPHTNPNEEKLVVHEVNLPEGPLERIQRLRQIYGEKMEARAAIFKKPS